MVESGNESCFQKEDWRSGKLYRTIKNLHYTTIHGGGGKLEKGTVLMYLGSSGTPTISTVTISNILREFGPGASGHYIRRRYNIFLGPDGEKIEILTFSNYSNDAFDKWFERIEL